MSGAILWIWESVFLHDVSLNSKVAVHPCAFPHGQEPPAHTVYWHPGDVAIVLDA